MGGSTGGSSGAGGDPGLPPVPYVEIVGVAYGRGTFVATGTEIAERNTLGRGVIYKSTDGVDWVRVVTDLPVVVSDVAFGNDRFVAIGSYISLGPGPAVRTASAFVSSDGESWTAVALPVSFVGMRFAFGNGQFIATGAEGHIKSVDGTNWTLFGAAASAGGGVEFAGGNFVILSSGGVWSTTGDGPLEPVQIAPDRSFGISRLHALNDSFVGLLESGCFRDSCPASETRWRAFSSPNGRDWMVGETVAAKPAVVAIQDGSVCVAFQGPRVLAGPNCGALERTVSEGFEPYGALYAGGVYFVTVPFGGILSSRDGVSWTKSL